MLGCGVLDGHCDSDLSKRLPNGSGILQIETLILAAVVSGREDAILNSYPIGEEHG